VIAAGIALLLGGLAVLFGARRLLWPAGEGRRRSGRSGRRAAERRARRGHDTPVALPAAPVRAALTAGPVAVPAVAETDDPDAWPGYADLAPEPISASPLWTSDDTGYVPSEPGSYGFEPQIDWAGATTPMADAPTAIIPAVHADPDTPVVRAASAAGEGTVPPADVMPDEDDAGDGAGAASGGDGWDVDSAGHGWDVEPAAVPAAEGAVVSSPADRDAAADPAEVDAGGAAGAGSAADDWDVAAEDGVWGAAAAGSEVWPGDDFPFGRARAAAVRRSGLPLANVEAHVPPMFGGAAHEPAPAVSAPAVSAPAVSAPAVSAPDEPRPVASAVEGGAEAREFPVPGTDGPTFGRPTFGVAVRVGTDHRDGRCAPGRTNAPAADRTASYASDGVGTDRGGNAVGGSGWSGARNDGWWDSGTNLAHVARNSRGHVHRDGTGDDVSAVPDGADLIADDADVLARFAAIQAEAAALRAAARDANGWANGNDRDADRTRAGEHPTDDHRATAPRDAERADRAGTPGSPRSDVDFDRDGSDSAGAQPSVGWAAVGGAGVGGPVVGGLPARTGSYRHIPAPASVPVFHPTGPSEPLILEPVPAPLVPIFDPSAVMATQIFPRIVDTPAGRPTEDEVGDPAGDAEGGTDETGPGLPASQVPIARVDPVTPWTEAAHDDTAATEEPEPTGTDPATWADEPGWRDEPTGDQRRTAAAGVHGQADEGSDEPEWAPDRSDMPHSGTAATTSPDRTDADRPDADRSGKDKGEDAAETGPGLSWPPHPPAADHREDDVPEPNPADDDNPGPPDWPVAPVDWPVPDAQAGYPTAPVSPAVGEPVGEPVDQPVDDADDDRAGQHVPKRRVTVARRTADKGPEPEVRQRVTHPRAEARRRLTAPTEVFPAVADLTAVLPAVAGEDEEGRPREPGRPRDAGRSWEGEGARPRPRPRPRPTAQERHVTRSNVYVSRHAAD
jgi:hypothetical protein